MKNFQFQIFNLQKKQNRGFTLVESVVAAGVFAVAMTTITAAVLAVMRVDEKSRAIRAVEQNARFVSEFLQRELRNGTLDYNSYPSDEVPNDGQTNELFLVNAAGDRERVFLGANNRLRLEKTTGGNTYTTDLTSSNVTIDNIIFYINPDTDPFVPGGPDQQPVVVYVLGLTSNTNSRARDQISMDMQGTVSLRNYPR